MFEFDHLKKNNFTYFQHLRRASIAATMMGAGAFLGLVHSMLPFVFHESMTKISKKIVDMHNQPRETS